MNPISPLLLVVIAFLLYPACHPQKEVSTARDVVGDIFSKVIYFEVNKAEVTEAAPIDDLSGWLKQNQDKVVILEGHADQRGGREFNLRLGDQRSRAVMQALLETGVPEQQVIVMSYGEDRPASNKPGEDGWSKNRRVEFVVR